MAFPGEMAVSEELPGASKLGFTASRTFVLLKERNMGGGHDGRGGEGVLAG